MSKLDKIEADLHRYARRSDPPVFQDYGDLLTRAARQLGPFAVHAHHHISCETYDNLECSCGLDNQLAGVDPDVLDLIPEIQNRG